MDMPMYCVPGTEKEIYIDDLWRVWDSKEAHDKYWADLDAAKKAEEDLNVQRFYYALEHNIPWAVAKKLTADEMK